MADENAIPICSASAGVHIVLPGYYSPGNTGLLVSNLHYFDHCI